MNTAIKPNGAQRSAAPYLSNLARHPLVPLRECLRQFNERFERNIPLDSQPDFAELANLKYWAREHGEPLLAYYFARYEEAATPQVQLEAAA